MGGKKRVIKYNALIETFNPLCFFRLTKFKKKKKTTISNHIARVPYRAKAEIPSAFKSTS